jgi:hypothetical protein
VTVVWIVAGVFAVCVTVFVILAWFAPTIDE